MAKNTHNHYETTFIVDSIFEDERVDAIVNKYTGFFTKNGGEVLKTEKWGRKKMAYAIKKKQTGSYVSIEFTAEPSVIAKLERAYHLDDDIMRFLTVTFDKKTLVEREVYLLKKEQILAEREAAAKLAANPPTGTEQSAVTDKVAEAKPEDKKV
jgi:small subunit ribosomal protein S6